MMKRQIFEVLNYILSEKIEFGVLVKIENVEFDPILPENIADKFSEVTYFVLAEYTFESAKIDENYLFFEAGFGEDNFGSVVKVPFLAIVQILIDENPIFINVAQEIRKKRVTKEQRKRRNRSKNIFLSNPENSQFK